MASPPLSPTLTAHPHRKRRHSEIVDLALDGHASNGTNGFAVPEIIPRHPSAPEDSSEQHDDETDEQASDSDAESAFEEMADMAEAEPYLGSGPEAVSPDQAAELKRQLREIGPGRFINEVVLKSGEDPRKVGTAFGINPFLDLDDVSYFQVLATVLSREYTKRQKLSKYNNIEDAAYLIRKSQNIIVLTGAGISTSLGIPDFRSKEGGFYQTLQERGYADPQSVFDLREFDQDPKLFYDLAHEILPRSREYSPTHAFVKLLQTKGKLLTNYTQNIDNLEAAAGVEPDRLIQCHGSFATATCRKCQTRVKGETIFDDIRKKRVAYCKKCIADIEQRTENAPKKRGTSKPRHDWEDSADEADEELPGVMKPDITFFHEKLSNSFFDRLEHRDAKTVDLVIVIGTSLKVAPVSEIPNFLPNHVPHIYISNEAINHVNFDIQLLGQCDDVVVELCNHIDSIEWKLRHKMVPLDFKARVAMEDECPWKWRIVRDRSRRKDRLEVSPVRQRASASPMSQRSAASPMRQRASASPMPAHRRF